MIEPKPMSPERRADYEGQLTRARSIMQMHGVGASIGVHLLVAALADLLADAAYWRQQAEDAEQRNRRVICVYCGEVQQLSSPEKLREEMAAHIVVCPKHPMNLIVEVMIAAEALIERTEACPHCFDAGAVLDRAISNLGEKAQEGR